MILFQTIIPAVAKRTDGTVTKHWVSFNFSLMRPQPSLLSLAFLSLQLSKCLSQGNGQNQTYWLTDKSVLVWRCRGDISLTIGASHINLTCRGDCSFNGIIHVTAVTGWFKVCVAGWDYGLCVLDFCWRISCTTHTETFTEYIYIKYKTYSKTVYY